MGKRCCRHFAGIVAGCGVGFLLARFFFDSFHRCRCQRNRCCSGSDAGSTGLLIFCGSTSGSSPQEPEDLQELEVLQDSDVSRGDVGFAHDVLPEPEPESVPDLDPEPVWRFGDMHDRSLICRSLARAIMMSAADGNVLVLDRFMDTDLGLLRERFEDAPEDVRMSRVYAVAVSLLTSVLEEQVVMYLDGTSDRLYAALEANRKESDPEWVVPAYPSLLVTQRVLRAACDSLAGEEPAVMKVAFADGFDRYVREDDKEVMLEATWMAIDHLSDYRRRLYRDGMDL